MGFTRAVKSQAKLRAALFGPSGSGKTYSALEIATGIVSVIGGKIALIDSERSTASKYADRFVFDQDNLEVKDIDEYVQKIREAADAGYTVLIIDSLSHAWQMLLDSVEKLAQAKYKGNTWSAWSEGTPEQRKLVDAIVSFPGHIIVTMRSKTEWQTTTNDRGRTTPVRVGLAPEQGKGIEYEFDILVEISPDHIANIIKDRSGKFQDKIFEKPGKKFGQELIAWLNEGVVIPKTLEQQYKETLAEVTNILDSEDEGKRIFTAEEKESVMKKIKDKFAVLKDNREQKLDYLKEVLEEQKKIFHERLEKISGTTEETAPTSTAAENPAEQSAEQTSEPPTSETQQETSEPRPFEDDKPWEEGELISDGKKGKKKPQPSLKEAFEEVQRKSAESGSAGTETELESAIRHKEQLASAELDIF